MKSEVKAIEKPLQLRIGNQLIEAWKYFVDEQGNRRVTLVNGLELNVPYYTKFECLAEVGV